MNTSEYVELFVNSFIGYWEYLGRELTTLTWHSYFYVLILFTAVLLVAERIWPWRKQAYVRKGFWLDFFWMFFNFFLFSAIGFAASADVLSRFFIDLLAQFGIENTVALEVMDWPVWAQLLTLFVFRDFIHWNTHKLLHRVPWMWQIHKIHHGVTEMGVAAHLRFHWLENVVYRMLEYIPLSMIGFGIDDFFIVHTFALAIGHLNHSNLHLTYGPLRYLFNSPGMHHWHHVKHLPSSHPYGMNYGISLSLWDYLFGSAYWPESASGHSLGIENEEIPEENFWKQSLLPFVNWFKPKR